MTRRRSSKVAPATTPAPVPVVVTQLQHAANDFGMAKADFHARFDAASPDNKFMRRRDGLGGNGDAHIPEQALWRIRETSRHMVLNDDLPGQMISRLADNVVQEDGFRLIPRTGDAGLDRELIDRHRAWARDPRQCDYYGDRTFAQLQWISFFETVVDGDIFGLLTNSETGAIQLVEADRCRSQGIGPIGGDGDQTYNGHTLDSMGRVRTYHFTKRPGGQYESAGGIPTVGYDAYDADGFRVVCHMHDVKRISQHRGYPWLAPLMIKAGMLDDLQFATVVKAQNAATLAGFFEQDVATTGASTVRLAARDATAQATGAGAVATGYTESIRYGSNVTLPPGIKYKGHTTAIPNQEHFEHVRTVIRQMGAGLNMPLEMVLLDASQTNFSGWRGAMDQARMSFRRIQGSFMAQFHTPVHRMNVRRWGVEMGAVARRKMRDGTLFEHRWQPPSWPYVNPIDDAKAAHLMVTTGQDSPRGIVAKRGGAFDDVLEETIADRSKALRQAIAESQAIQRETGVSIDPVIILGWDLPSGSAKVAAADTAENVGTPGGAPAPGSPAPAGPGPSPDPTTPDDAVPA